MVHKFKNARQVRTGLNMVKSSSPNAPSIWPMLPRKLDTILLLAFALFELVAMLSHCLCSESNKKNVEVGEYPQ